MEQICYILTLPIENIIIILENLNTSSLLKLSQTSSYFNQLVLNSTISNGIWDNKLKEDFLLSKNESILKYNLVNNSNSNNNNTEMKNIFGDSDEDQEDEQIDDEGYIYEEILQEGGEEEEEEDQEQEQEEEEDTQKEENDEFKKITSYSIIKSLYNRFDSNIIHHYKTMRYIWNRLENWMDLNSMIQMKNSFQSIDKESFLKIKNSINFFEEDNTNSSNNSNNNKNNNKINNDNIFPGDYLCSILIHNGQKENTEYGLLGIVQAYSSKTNIFLFSFQQSHTLYLKTRHMLPFKYCWFVAGSTSRRYYVMVIKEFIIEGKLYSRGQILLIAPNLPIILASCFWEFLEQHATSLEKGILTTRNNVLYRYPEHSKYNGETVTQGVRIKSSAVYVPEDFNSFSFFYRITISMDIDEDPNNSCQLTRRFWTITTEEGSSNTDGPGVIGNFPIIKPGTTFEYCSKCEIEFPQGSMNGYFTMVKLNNRNELFRAYVPLFYLTTDQQ